MLVDLDLGQLDLQPAASDVQLKLTSSAIFAPSAEDEFDALRARLTACKLDTGSASWPWVLRGTSFRLTISLRVETVLSEHAQSELVEILSAQLASAKLWQQLGLSASRVESSFNVADCCRLVTVSLSHEDCASQPQREHHKLGADVPNKDVRPPQGISRTTLESVKLSICIGRSERHERGRFKRARSCTDVSSHIHDDAPRSMESNQVPDEDLFELIADKSSATEPLAVSGAPPDASQWLRTCDLEDPHDEDEAAMLLDVCALDGLSESSLCSRVAPLLKRTSSSVYLDSKSEDASMNTLIDLIDAAVRLAISKSPTRLPSGVSIKGRRSLLPLEKLAPSLWSPGYLTAVARRAVFLPTISHALASVCIKHAIATGPGSDAERATSLSYLQENSDAEVRACENEVSTTIHVSQQERLSIRLWQALQRRVHQPQAARKLKSISMSTEDAAEGSKRQGGFLEPDYQGYDPINRDGSDEDDEAFEELEIGSCNDSEDGLLDIEAEDLVYSITEGQAEAIDIDLFCAGFATVPMDADHDGIEDTGEELISDFEDLDSCSELDKVMGQDSVSESAGHQKVAEDMPYTIGLLRCPGRTEREVGCTFAHIV